MHRALRHVAAASLALALTTPLLAQQRGAAPAPAAPMTMTVAGFADGGTIPVKFTQAAPGVATGEGLSPAITWANVPAGTQSFVLNMHDMEVVRNKTSDDQAHWVVWNIPASSTGLPEACPRVRNCPTAASRSRDWHHTADPVHRQRSAASLHVRDLRT